MKKLLILFSIMFLFSCTPRERFKIKITFCDGRDPIITTTDVRSDRPPSNNYIDNASYGTYRRHRRYSGVAVPEYVTYTYISSGSPIKADNFLTKRYLNVCNVEVIK